MYVYVTLSVLWFVIGFVSYHATRTAVHEYRNFKAEQKNNH